MDVIIRKMELSEYSKLMPLWPLDKNLFFEYGEREDIRIGQREVFVIEIDNLFIGELSIYYTHEEADLTSPNQRVYLSALRVLKEYRGNGLGEKLINTVISYLKAKGYEEATIGVEEDNAVAIHIYNKAGFNSLLREDIDEWSNKKLYVLLKKI